jgi:hypothetical protein
MLTATTREPALLHTAAYITWATQPDNVAILA